MNKVKVIKRGVTVDYDHLVGELFNVISVSPELDVVCVKDANGDIVFVDTTDVEWILSHGELMKVINDYTKFKSENDDKNELKMMAEELVQMVNNLALTLDTLRTISFTLQMLDERKDVDDGLIKITNEYKYFNSLLIPIMSHIELKLKYYTNKG
jgi:hypothetical protein